MAQKSVQAIWFVKDGGKQIVRVHRCTSGKRLSSVREYDYKTLSRRTLTILTEVCQSSTWPLTILTPTTQGFGFWLGGGRVHR